MKKLIYLLLISFMAFGCGTKKKITTSHERDSIYIVKDSAVYIDRVTIDTVEIPADRAYIEALFDCDSLGHIRMREITRLENSIRTTANISVRGDTIFIECICDSLLVFNKLVEKYDYVRRSEISNVTVEDSKDTLIVRSPWYLRFWWIWIIVFAAIAVATKVFKLW